MHEEPSDGLRLSVVLATYNRADTMRKTLRCLNEQTLAPESYEIVIVDDGSPDDTEAMVRETLPGMRPQTSYTRHENQGPGFTINRGIERARAPLLLIMADDILFSRGALEAHVRAHAAHPAREVAILGKVLQSDEHHHSVFLKHWDQFGMRSIGDVEEFPWYKFWACNISVKADFMREHGMFRPPRGRAGAPAHEDVEVGYRLKDHGLRILYEQAALGYHHHVFTLEQAIKRYHDRGLNWGEFREYVPDPEITVHNHVLTWHTLGEYRAALGRPNHLQGREKWLAWHLFRHAVYRTAFNRLSVALLWRPLIDLAERNRLAERLMSAPLYRAFLYYHFLRGVADAEHHFGGTATKAPAS